MSSRVGFLAADEAARCLRGEDIRTDIAGLKMQQFLPSTDNAICAPKAPAFEYVPDLRCLRWVATPTTDAEGSIYFTIENAGIGLPPHPSVIWRTRRNGKTEKVAHIDAREISPGLWARPSIQGFLIDSSHGLLYLVLRCTCEPSQPAQVCSFSATSEVARISGLPTLQAGHGRRDD